MPDISRPIATIGISGLGNSLAVASWVKTHYLQDRRDHDHAPPPRGMNMSKLTRPREGRIIGGVCQGIANSLRLDPTIVRVVAALLILMAGSGPVI